MNNRLKVGQIYCLAGTNKVTKFYCFEIKDNKTNTAILQNIVSGWTIVCHDIQFESEDSISWSYSTDGYFVKGSN